MKGNNILDKTVNSDNSDDSSNKNEYPYTAIHTYLPFYDFKMADKSYGVDFSVFSDKGFYDFLKDKYLTILVDLRKSYHKKDLKYVKEWAHKIKGAFVYLNSPFVAESANLLMKAAMEGLVDNLEDLYVDLLVKINIFLEKLIELGKKIENPIKNEFLHQYIKVNNELDSREKQETRSKFILHAQKIKESIANLKPPEEIVNNNKTTPDLKKAEEFQKTNSQKENKVTPQNLDIQVNTNNTIRNKTEGSNNIKNSQKKDECNNEEDISLEKGDTKANCCKLTDCIIY